MKITNAEVRSKNAETRQRSAAGLLPSAFCLQPSRRGMALIITLILLSITLIMAVAFLAIARRERNAVTTTTDTAIARLATDSALAAATAQMAANIFASTNLGAYDSHLLVSTNYINPIGYVPGSQSPTNVNYDYRFGGGALNGLDLEQNIANLWLLPRAPVLASAKEPYAGRFWLDLNRNGYFDPSGWVQETNSAGLPTLNPPVFEAGGDPEWIGVLERPDQPHGPNNRFVARYAFLSQPIGNSLDLNYIHNEVFDQNLNAFDGYFRNQGVGSWELNLASFLADLNTNEWGQAIGAPSLFYQYNQPLNPNIGYAFEDARALLSWRYNNTYSSLRSVNQLFGNPSVFQFDGIDGYTDGKLQTTVDTNADFTADAPNLSWAGADSTNRFFSLPSELFDPTKSSVNFYNRLSSAGISNSTYDRYTFYRLLDQLGTGSTADDTRLNLNYRNVTNGVIVPGLETNLAPWTAAEFFTNAADRMLLAYTKAWFQADPTNYLRTYFGINPPGYLDANGVGITNLQYAGQLNEIPAFGVTNIPVYVNGRFVYSPAVNRLLQLAANIYDAGNTNWYPSVFRPVFHVVPNGTINDVYVRSYQQVVLDGTPYLATPIDVESLLAGNAVQTNVFGVPWILGAKKGLPNFQMAAMLNCAQVTRKLLVTRTLPNTNGVYTTYQKDMVSITNNISVSLWNSYNNDYVSHAGVNGITVFATNLLDMMLTNDVPKIWIQPTARFGLLTNLTVWGGSQWYGTPPSDDVSVNANPFIYANWSFPFQLARGYDFSINDFKDETDPTFLWLSATNRLPQFGLLTTNRLQAFILDGTHVVDYVQFRGPSRSTNLNTILADPPYTGNNNQPRYQWSTNQPASSPFMWGVSNQIIVSRNYKLAPGGTWVQSPNFVAKSGFTTPKSESSYFDAFFTGNQATNNYGAKSPNTDLVAQAPYAPVRTVYDYTLWQANDPLVHYLASDLTYVGKAQGSSVGAGNDGNAPVPSVSYYDAVYGDRYQPWGRKTQMEAAPTPVDFNAYQLAYRDPLVWRSDYWGFPTNPLPTVGWLGRVHRGTPWQTVFLKSTNILTDANLGTNTWAYWSGNQNVFDAANSAPVQDRLLFDLFTTRFNDNAVRGALSVNQTHLAAWSAVFGGLVTLFNTAVSPNPGSVPATTYMVIDPAGPAGNASVLGQLVNGSSGINAARTKFVNPDGLVGAFEHAGDILSVPALTVASPLLNLNWAQNGISDALYEWLPQQTLGLLRVDDTPRFVVYCFGQTLKPARDSLVLDNSAGQFGLCTNYQVTAENAARAVIRLERHITATGTNFTPVVESYNPLPPQ